MKKYKKFIPYVISVSLITWLSNYLYESLDIYSLYDNIFKGIPAIKQTLVDRAFNNAVIGTYGLKYSDIILSISSACFAFAVFDLVYYFKKHDKFHRLGSLVSRIGLLLTTIFLIFTSLISASVYKDVSSAEYNFQIVRAYMDDSNYDKMVSNFYQINCEKDFNKVNSQLQTVAEENNLSLKKVFK